MLVYELQLPVKDSCLRVHCQVAITSACNHAWMTIFGVEAKPTSRLVLTMDWRIMDISRCSNLLQCPGPEVNSLNTTFSIPHNILSVTHPLLALFLLFFASFFSSVILRCQIIQDNGSTSAYFRMLY